MSRLQLIGWYLSRPAYFTHFLTLIADKIESIIAPASYQRHNQLATEWCKSLAASRDQVLTTILGTDKFTPFEQEYHSEIQAAQQRADAVPVKMGGAGDIGLIYHLAEHIGALRVIETGVAYGWSSLALLLSITNRQGSHLISTDMPYSDRQNDQYVGCVVPDSLRSNWTLIRLPDRAALPQALQQMPVIDLVHYDSDKSYNGRMWAYPRLWAALRPGGILISDDIQDNQGFHDFCQQIKLNPYIISSGNKYVGVLIKPL